MIGSGAIVAAGDFGSQSRAGTVIGGRGDTPSKDKHRPPRDRSPNNLENSAIFLRTFFLVVWRLCADF